MLNRSNTKLQMINKKKDFYFKDEDKILVSKLEIYLDNLVFLKPNFRIFDLSILLETPPNHVSKLIRHVYGYKFADFIMYHKLNYLDTLIEQELKQNNKLKFTTLFNEAGFKSRSNFYFAFDKIRNSSPKVYYNNLYPGVSLNGEYVFL